VGFNNTRSTTNSTFATLSPTLGSNFQARFTQHLLQGFGFAPNTRFIRIAKNNREISDVAFRLQIITTVDQIENIYWDLVYAYENVRVQNESLAFAQKTLSDTQKQVEIGTLAPIETVRAQSTVASDQQQLTLALTNLQLQQLLMKNALSRTLVDPRLADAEVIPTSTMRLPDQEPVVPTQDLVNEALSRRGELAEARINLKNQEISIKSVRSSLLPSLDLYGYYGGSGLGGAQNAANLCPPPPQPQPFGCSTNPVTPVSYGSTLNQLVNSTAPDKGVGLQLTIPLRNRVAQATQIRSELEYRQGTDAAATTGKPGAHRNPQRPVCGAAEPGQCIFRAGGG
jgi:outer membrane protein TolC